MNHVFTHKQPNKGRTPLVWFISGSLLLSMGSGCLSSVTHQPNALSSSPPAVTSAISSGSESRQSAVAIDADWFVDLPMMHRSLVEEKPSNQEEHCPEYRGGVVNHHTLSPDLLAEFFKELGRCRGDVKTMIILSPDHYQGGEAPLVTHTAPYRTHGKDVLIVASSVQRLLTMAPFGRLDPKPFTREHGIAALVPFLHQVFPQVSIVPLAVDGRITAEDGARVIEWLKQEMQDPQTLLVVSSDMSHYLSDEQALQNDRRTMRAFENGDASFFFRVSDDYTDNGKGIWIALRALEPKKWHFLNRKSSTAYGGSILNTTTYINGLWSSDEP